MFGISTKQKNYHNTNELWLKGPPAVKGTCCEVAFVEILTDTFIGKKKTKNGQEILVTRKNMVINVRGTNSEQYLFTAR